MCPFSHRWPPSLGNNQPRASGESGFIPMHFSMHLRQYSAIRQPLFQVQKRTSHKYGSSRDIEDPPRYSKIIETYRRQRSKTHVSPSRRSEIVHQSSVFVESEVHERSAFREFIQQPPPLRMHTKPFKGLAHDTFLLFWRHRPTHPKRALKSMIRVRRKRGVFSRCIVDTLRTRYTLPG